MKTFLTVLMIASFSGSMAMAIEPGNVKPGQIEDKWKDSTIFGEDDPDALEINSGHNPKIQKNLEALMAPSAELIKQDPAFAEAWERSLRGDIHLFRQSDAPHTGGDLTQTTNPTREKAKDSYDTSAVD